MFPPKVERMPPYAKHNVDVYIRGGRIWGVNGPPICDGTFESTFRMSIVTVSMSRYVSRRSDIDEERGIFTPDASLVDFLGTQAAGAAVIQKVYIPNMMKYPNITYAHLGNCPFSYRLNISPYRPNSNIKLRANEP